MSKKVKENKSTKAKKSKKEKTEEGLFFTKHEIDPSIEEDLELDSEEEELERENLGQVKRSQTKSKAKNLEQDLLEIYGEDGNWPDFKTIKIKKRTPWWLRFFYFLLFLAVLGAGSYFLYDYWQRNKDNSSILEVKIEAPNKIILGEDFFYDISYFNNSNNILSELNLEIVYPENFILTEIYSIDNYEDNRFWEIRNLGPKIGGKIKIKGKIINKEGSNNLLNVKSEYKIKGLSSEFFKNSFFNNTVGSLSFKVKEDYFYTVLLGEDYPLSFDFKDFPFNNIPGFQLFFEDSDNLIITYDDKANKDLEREGFLEKIDEHNFNIMTTEREEFTLNFRYQAKEQKENSDFISWGLKYLDEEGREFIFYERKNQLELIRSDLHLSLLVNDQSEDFPVDFGESLNYLIKYANKGDKTMKDLVIMAVINSDFVNFNSLNDLNGGKLSRKTITWTYKEVPDLKNLEPGQKGEISFSLNLSNPKKIDLSQNLKVESYAQFTIGNMEDFSERDDYFTNNRSNIISNNLNSDLSIKERVLYFDDDNIPVGSGPLPPEVGEKTSFRYYWTLKNTLHELKDLKLELDLPSYVLWEDNYNLSAGNLYFQSDEHKVIFEISRWPIGVAQIDVDFNVSVIPSELEYNKIIILSSGSELAATDTITGAIISKKTEVKTSKLEDDDIAAFSNDGRVK